MRFNDELMLKLLLTIIVVIVVITIFYYSFNWIKSKNQLNHKFKKYNTMQYLHYINKLLNAYPHEVQLPLSTPIETLMDAKVIKEVPMLVKKPFLGANYANFSLTKEAYLYFKRNL